MDKTILITLNGHAKPYALDVAAHARLEQYLDGAATRLHADPDRAEILADLERGIGDRLAGLPGASGRLVSLADIDQVIDAIGAVDAGHDPILTSPTGPAAPHGPASGRRLRRIRTGQQLVGVCTGLSAYSEIRVDWVRTLFVLATVFSAGIFAVVYLALAFILPVA